MKGEEFMTFLEQDATPMARAPSHMNLIALVNRILTGENFDFHCHSNLTRAILPYHLTEFDVHDVLNVVDTLQGPFNPLFQCTGLNKNDQYFMKSCPAKVGDYFEFFAEIGTCCITMNAYDEDLLAALSTCPAGSLEVPLWGTERVSDDELKRLCHPLQVQVWELSDKTLLERWQSPNRAEYDGIHGIKL